MLIDKLVTPSETKQQSCTNIMQFFDSYDHFNKITKYNWILGMIGYFSNQSAKGTMS